MIILLATVFSMARIFGLAYAKFFCCDDGMQVSFLILVAVYHK